MLRRVGAGSCIYWPCWRSSGRDPKLLFDIAVRVELFEVGPQVGGFLWVLDAKENHLGSRYLCSGVGDVFLECRLIPHDTRIFVRVRVVVAGDRSGFAAIKTVLNRTDLVLGTRTNRVARCALNKRLLARS